MLLPVARRATRGEIMERVKYNEPLGHHAEDHRLIQLGRAGPELLIDRADNFIEVG